MYKIIILTLLVLFFVYIPGISAFERITPEEVGLQSSLLNELDQKIHKDYPYIYSFLILKDGKLVFEQYYNGHNQNTKVLVASVTKSFLSTVVGIAYDRGCIDLEKNIVDYFTEYQKYIIDEKIYDIKLKHLLNMTSGIKYNVTSEIVKWIQADDQVKYALEAPVLTTPGKTFRYNDPAVHLLTYIVNKETDTGFSEFVQENLFQPLGITEYNWEKDRLGTPYGSHGLWLKPRDMIKLGQLYLNGGTWNGKKIISEEWIKLATTKKIFGGFPYRGHYGYLWWVDETDGYRTYFAAGYGGQFIIVIPELGLVVGINSDIKAHRDVYIRNLVREYIIPSLN